MDCRTCHRAMLTTGNHVLKDDKGTMTVTRWRCRPCHETAEEIFLNAENAGRKGRCIRYAVATPPYSKVTNGSRRGAMKGKQTYAVTG